jgi:hypothetical protein
MENQRLTSATRMVPRRRPTGTAPAQVLFFASLRLCEKLSRLCAFASLPETIFFGPRLSLALPPRMLIIDGRLFREVPHARSHLDI